MRIACVHVPQFALQSLSRIDPALRGAAVAVVGGGFDAAGARPSLALHSPIVLACSRAAWHLGVRLGMTASAARFVSPELRVVAADVRVERETVRAIADALLGVSAVVDAGGRVEAGGTHLAMYCQVPSKARATTFGERLLELVGMFGLTARIGIADDRFTAWVAAAHGAAHGVVGATEDGARDAESRRVARARGISRPRPASAMPADAEPRLHEGVGVPQQPTGRRKAGEAQRIGSASEERGVICVPRGGSAAFLAPRPLSLLAITPEVQHMLEALGVRTLGEFAALPAPSVARPLEQDYQALARGDSGSALRPYAPEAPIREEVIAGQADNLFGDTSAVATLARRVALRLAGRARAAIRLDVAITGEAGDRALPISAGRAVRTEQELVELLAPVIATSNRGAAEGRRGVGRLSVVVVSEAIAEAADRDAEAAADAAPERTVEVTVEGAPAGSSKASIDSASEQSIDALTLALSGMPPRQRPRAPVGRPGQAVRVTGDQRWQLSAPEAARSERRTGHRRTRRAKPRRALVIAQSQLFGKGEG